MTLTGKAKEDFEKWLKKKIINIDLELFYGSSDTVEAAYKQEWFDSVGIYIDCPPFFWDRFIGYGCLVNEKLYFSENENRAFRTRNEALKAAITNANLIYNERS